MRRREFIKLAGAAATVSWPLRAEAQQPSKIYRIGFLANDPRTQTDAGGQAFIEALSANGFVDGKNILIDWRFAEGKADQHAASAAALVRLQMDLIVASTNSGARAAKEATKSIPIIVMNVSDPLGQGLVTSLAAPTGNITGLTLDVGPQILSKRLQFLKEAVHNVRRIAVLFDSNEPYSTDQRKILDDAARSLGIDLEPAPVGKTADFDQAFEGITRVHSDAVIVVNGALVFTARNIIADLSLKTQLPTMSAFREMTEAGCFLSYGAIRADSFRRAAIYVAKILKGAKPSELPIEQPISFELVVNKKTAKILGIELSPSLLALADGIVE
jgi:putative tryptophan/tyrosine transport system substrate-binding protein